MATMLAFEDRIAGAALGQALGDALGYQVERQPPEVTLPYARAWLLDGGEPERLRDGYPMGQVSDDTQCSKVLLEAVVARGGYDPLGHARALVAFKDDLVGGGKTVPFSLRRLAACPEFLHGDLPAAMEACAADDRRRHGEGIPTNGAAMRIWPLGALFEDPLQVLREARDAARLTHMNEEAVACAMVMALATRLVLGGAAPGELLAGLGPLVAHDAGCRRVVDTALDMVRVDDEAARGIAWDLSGRDPVWRAVSPRALPTAAWALRAYERGGDDLARTLCLALGAGGDVDTLASLAGTWMGARHGPGGLPPALVARIGDRGRWGAGDLEALARAFAKTIRPEVGAQPGLP